jgi:hypothetical protein
MENIPKSGLHEVVLGTNENIDKYEFSLVLKEAGQ